MKIEDAGILLAKKIEFSVICSPKGTPLSRASGEILEMACAYLNDGGTFMESGDSVNGLASYAYGLGWLDAGIRTGMISCTVDEGLIMPAYDEEIPSSLREHLEEKTGRYCRMLESAIDGSGPAPDHGSPLYSAAKDIFAEAESCLKAGIMYKDGEAEGGLSSALWQFSYGYGWLDAGVRMGIISITGDRKLFTI